jgi:hypothetical protein
MDDTTKATIPSDNAGLREELDDARKLLTSVRRTLAGLLESVREGQGSLSEIVKKHGELETALTRVFQTEQKYNDWLAKRSGDLAPGEIDFEALRDEIGCRLARLVECCQEG